MNSYATYVFKIREIKTKCSINMDEIRLQTAVPEETFSKYCS